MTTLWFVTLFAVIGWSAGQSLSEIVSQEVEEEIAKRSSSCSGKWKTIKDSTMCTSRDSPYAKDCGVSEADKKMILDTHNRLRAKVSPESSDMLKMYWNDDLAVVAQKWAKHGQSAHDTNANRQIPGTGRGMFIGQSWASGGIFKDWRAAIEDGWFSEVKDFSYGSSYHRGVVGHYTQVVQGPANLVGCGKCMVNGSPLYICNYFRGNSMDKGRPYIKGSKCGNCKKCVDGLCDCGNVMCKNNGTMNAKTCTCDCPGKYKGDDCGKYDCPAKDVDACSSFYKGKCDIWSNVPGECPYMCGLCKAGDGGNGGDGGNRGGSCEDSNGNCAGWARRGECERNPGWMKPNCKKSCKTC